MINKIIFKGRKKWYEIKSYKWNNLFNIFTNNTKTECPVMQILILNNRALGFRKMNIIFKQPLKFFTRYFGTDLRNSVK